MDVASEAGVWHVALATLALACSPNAQEVASSGGVSAGGGGQAASRAPSGGGGDRGAIMARAGAVLGSCWPDDGIERNLVALWHPARYRTLWDRFATQVDCLATHGNGCEAVENCLGYRVVRDPTACTQGCSDSTYTYCASGFRITLDCSKLGLACDPYAICSESPSAPCDSASFARSCDATGVPVFCDDDAVQHGPDCPALGLVCSGGYCLGGGDACSGDSPDPQGIVSYQGIACSHEQLDACVGLRRQLVDCTGMAPGFHCQAVGGVPFCGLASECHPADVYGVGQPDLPVCEGNTVVFCSAGRVERVDCASLGFSGCDVTNAYGCVPTPFTSP